MYQIFDQLAMKVVTKVLFTEKHLMTFSPSFLFQRKGRSFFYLKSLFLQINIKNMYKLEN